MCAKLALTYNIEHAITKNIRIDVATAINGSTLRETSDIFGEVWNDVFMSVDQIIWPIHREVKSTICI